MLSGKLLAINLFFCLCTACLVAHSQTSIREIKNQFINPSNRYKPGVYWYFMDGNMSAETIRKDLQSMKQAGISSAIFFQVRMGLPRGPVEYLSDKWFLLLKFALAEAKRNDINISLSLGPGWQGSGGPWIRLEKSTQLLQMSETIVSANDTFPFLPVPPPPRPYFTFYTIPSVMDSLRRAYYQDIAVLAFPLAKESHRLAKYAEKALQYRDPYSSDTVKPFISLPEAGDTLFRATPASEVIDLTNKLSTDNKLNWRPDTGTWMVMRFVSRNSGATTLQTPESGEGFEADKFDSTAMNPQFNNYISRIIKLFDTGFNQKSSGLKTLHMDSWEVSSQNWSSEFRRQFLTKRGYDLIKYLPVYYGHVIESAEESERFLWDMRKTTQDLIFENHVNVVRKYAHHHGLTLSIEPYDMNQTSDLDYGTFADIPMAEFWSKDYDFNTKYTLTEATSIAHIQGQSEVGAEAFTAWKDEGWRQHPGSMKNQGDWAFASGITKFMFHTFANQFLPDSLKPGATMGPFGIHWDRSQTWWPMVSSYHTYITRCQYLLQQGRTVADILYLTPEGNPNVFVPPASALTTDAVGGDRKGFNFDGCSGQQLMRAKVINHSIRFSSGATYKVLVLPAFKTITPELLSKIEELVRAGAIIIGPRPVKSPSLVNYPSCDIIINKMAEKLWGASQSVSKITYHPYGKGTVIFGGNTDSLDGRLYPYYETIASILKQQSLTEDFTASKAVRYTHRTSDDWDIYFLSNTTNQTINFDAHFRTTKGAPELWDAISGQSQFLHHYTRDRSGTGIFLKLHPFESRFVIFAKGQTWQPLPGKAIFTSDTITDVSHNWVVSFDPKWGGPAHTKFKDLQDWSLAKDDGIKYYSGTATYTKSLTVGDIGKEEKGRYIYLDLGQVKNIARVTVNGKDLGIVWTAPWRVDVTDVLKQGENSLQIEVVNLWANRLIGDEKLASDGPKDGQWPAWLLNGQPRPGKRYTFTTTRQYSADSPLQSSGLLGPVSLIREDNSEP